MPLLKFDVIKGRNEEDLKKLLDAAHEAMVESFEVPDSDRYQIVSQHDPSEMIIKDTDLGFDRSKDIVVISIVSKTRSQDMKEKLYNRLAERLSTECNISPEDLMVNITENNDADWSFGGGEAQFLTGKL